LILSINGSVILNFASTSETNNNGYEILKSINSSPFLPITLIKGKGNSYQLETYSYEDKNVKNGDFISYQLKQHDTNGFSKIIAKDSIQVLNSEIVLSEVFPNPTYRNAFISIHSPKKIKVELLIKNTVGMIIGKYNYEINEGKTEINLPLESLSKGLYFLVFILKDNSIIRKLVLN